MKLDPHVHTSQVSGCGKLTGETMAEQYAAAGYGAVIVTDHINKNTPGGEFFLSGFRALKTRAEEVGLLALPGAEARLVDLGIEDYLIYGPETAEDADWLIRLMKTEPSLADFFRQVRARGWLMIQAHPYRDGSTVAAAPDCLDGVEAINLNPRHTPYNEKAQAFARANGLIATGGSDAHRPEDVGRSGLIVPDTIQTIGDFIRFLQENPNSEIILPEKV